MNCPTPEELSRWVDGTIDSASERALAAHAGACARCLRKASELRAAVDWIETAAGPGPRCLSAEEMAAVLDGNPAPAHVRTCPRCAAELASLGVPARRVTVRHYRRRSQAPVWAAAAAALVAAGLVALLYATRERAPEVAKEAVERPEAKPSPAPVRPPPLPPPPSFPTEPVPAPEPAPAPRTPEPAPVPPVAPPPEPVPVPAPKVDPPPPRSTVAEKAPPRAVPLAVRTGGLSGLVGGKWVRSPKVEEGMPLRADGRTAFDFSGAHLTAEGSSRFALFDGEIALHEGGVAAEVPAGVKLAVAIGRQKVVPQTSSARAILVARPDRVVVEEGSARAGALVLAEGVEHLLKKDRLEPQKRRSLPAAPRPREVATWKLDFSNPGTIRPRLNPGRLIVEREERMLGSVPLEGNAFFHAQVAYAVYDERGLFQVKPGTAIRFRYFLSRPASLEAVLWNITKDENFNKPLEAVAGQWTTVTLPARDLPANPGGKKAACDVGDRFRGFGLFVGTPGTPAELYIDQLEILEIDR